MKNLKRNPLLFKLLIIGIICIITACVKPEKRTYYKTIGIGYVYNETNNKPLKGVSIEILNYFICPGWGCLWDSDTVVTDDNGYFQVRFMENLDPDLKIIGYNFTVADWGPVSHDMYYRFFKYQRGSDMLEPSDFEGETIFELDTIKFYKHTKNQLNI
jgi:hypothetical protein